MKTVQIRAVKWVIMVVTSTQDPQRTGLLFWSIATLASCINDAQNWPMGFCDSSCVTAPYFAAIGSHWSLESRNCKFWPQSNFNDCIRRLSVSLAGNTKNPND